MNVALCGQGQTVLFYPIPAKDYLYFKDNLNCRKVVITDLAGKVILKETMSKGLNNIKIGQIAAGCYFIKLSEGQKSETLNL